MQAEPTPTPTPPGGDGPSVININLDLSALAELIWRWVIDHVSELGTAAWTPLSSWASNGLRDAARAVWDAVWSSSANIVTQLPPDLTYNFGPYRAIAADPVPLAVGGATLALVLLGLRTVLGSLVGHDHVITHTTGRLIPAVLLTLAYPVLLARGFGLLNAAASGLGQVSIGDALAFPSVNPASPLQFPYVLLWLLLIYYGIRLVIRLAYSLFRLLVALVFGPVALILWAIPQTEWITALWLRELLGWATTPLLVTACLAMAMPLASGRGGILAAMAFGIAGLQAAYDLVGFLTLGSARGGRLLPVPYVSAGAIAAAAAGGGAGAAAASVPANRLTTLADQYGYQ